MPLFAIYKYKISQKNDEGELFKQHEAEDYKIKYKTPEECFGSFFYTGGSLSLNVLKENGKDKTIENEIYGNDVLIVVGRDKASERLVKNYEQHFSVRSEFNNTSYLDRYRILCQKLILDRHYTSTALLWTSDANTYGDLSVEISVQSFINSFTGYLIGVNNEFK